MNADIQEFLNQWEHDICLLFTNVAEKTNSELQEKLKELSQKYHTKVFEYFKTVSYDEQINLYNSLFDSFRIVCKPLLDETQLIICELLK